MKVRYRPTRYRSARGAVIIHVAIALLGLMAFSALSIDYGVMWVSRRQAQNAADAAALAGAISLAFVDADDQARARRAAEAAGEANLIWNQAPTIDPDADIFIGTCPPGMENPSDVCVRANVYRNVAHGNPLPTYFAQLLDIDEQGVRATATARVLVGNIVPCMRPWAIPDKWYDARDTDAPIEGTPTWTWEDKYERYFENGPNKGQLLPAPYDCYHAALNNFSGPHLNNCTAGIGPTSFDVDVDRGTRVRLKPGNPNQALTAGWFFPIDLPIPGEPDTGGNRYKKNIAECNADSVGLGETIWNEPGNMIGPTGQGVDELVAQDPGATWNGTDVVGGAFGRNNSPRIVPIPVFNVEAYQMQDKTSGRFQLQITNILGFFVERMQGNDVTGILMPISARYDSGGATVDGESAFLYAVVLVR
jgi:Flp pilus assembly protein TadG